jgi:hypothetical protein
MLANIGPSKGRNMLPHTHEMGSARLKSFSFIAAYLREFGAKILKKSLPEQANPKGYFSGGNIS